MIRVVLPHHLRTLAHVGDEIHVDPDGSMTVRAIIDAIEEKYPVLRGTIRDHETKSAGHWSDFSRAAKTSPTNHLILPCLIRLQKVPSRFSSWAQSPAGNPRQYFGGARGRVRRISPLRMKGISSQCKCTTYEIPDHNFVVCRL